MNQEEVRKHMTDFLTSTTISTNELARKHLINFRNLAIGDFSVKDSRSLWLSLLFYKFRKENNIPDHLYIASRSYLLASISLHSSIEDIKNKAKNYLSLFNEWKIEDHNSLVDEVVKYYLDVLHLKHAIEETKDENTVSEWKDSYQSLIIKIRDFSNQMGFLSELDRRVLISNSINNAVIKETMKQAYWDMIENDIISKNYISVISQLIEIKNLLKEIVPSSLYSDLDEKFDIDFIQSRLNNETIDSSYIINLFYWVIHTMKECDSSSYEALYDKEIKTWEEAFQLLEWPRFLRFSLELCTLLCLDAKTRIGIWRSLLKT
jgi:hypothetical protein